MEVHQIRDYLLSLVADLPEPTVDRVIYGDPGAEVTGIAVAWMPYRDTIARAQALGASLLVVHEPTFYDHWDMEGQAAPLPAVDEKKALLDTAALAVIRCHDVWDALPGEGIPFAWGRFLGLGEPARSVRYYNLYQVEPQPARTLARRVSARTASLGQPAVGFYGDGERTVRTVGLGTGCISDPFTLYDLGADLAVSVDDVVRAWIAGEWCRDTGNPLVVVNHAVSEEPGMAALAAHLARAFPGLPVWHIPQGCSYEPVGVGLERLVNYGCTGATP